MELVHYMCVMVMLQLHLVLSWICRCCDNSMSDVIHEHHYQDDLLVACSIAALRSIRVYGHSVYANGRLSYMNLSNTNTYSRSIVKFIEGA